ncbi:sodium/potassium-transporting ATPase subunit beta-3a isoform X1 [Clupea harengus]|uniref:Sodium/potassium-transporting ATPase subunit beta n=1 Tax=Clupea harengus TaxID=7950 RepID=A0A6P3VVY1_CLUHA|nr:sodium/potassium-transporting ATPase subunit beta-3a isoform X1 [Clupea harengus]
MTKEEQKPGEGKEGKTRWTDCIYNPRTGEFIGRNASSWGLILLFYLVFYGFLAGFFCLTMWVMLLTLEDHVPKYNDRVPSPGLVIRPKSLDIVYNRSDPANYGQYIRHLDTFLQRYNDSEQASNELCLAGEFYDQDAEAQKKACQFRRSTLRICSGISDPNYGYSEGKPCILVKMNRIIGLKPQGEPYVNCTAKRDSPLSVQYFPAAARIDKMYFPYYGKKVHEKYVQPLVAVKLLLTKEDYNKEITVECRVEGSNLRNNDERDKFLGRVTFRVLVTQ